MQAIDVTQAKANPSKIFEHPTDVLTHPELTRETKIDILRQWESDARLLSVAEDENMRGGGEGSRLAAVVSALIALGDEKHLGEEKH